MNDTQPKASKAHCPVAEDGSLIIERIRKDMKGLMTWNEYIPVTIIPTALVQELLDMLDARWSFNNEQVHTHTWHDKQDAMEELRRVLGDSQ